MTATWHFFPDDAASARQLAQDVAARLRHAQAAHGRAVLAVSGGRSPVAFFEALREQPLEWEQLKVQLVDERFVPVEDPDSNEKLLRDHLLKGAASAARFHGLVNPAMDMPACVALANEQSSTPTVTVLGMGEDGHTASLFPQASQLMQGLDASTGKFYVHVTPPAAAHERISMTLPAILSSGHVMIAISGSRKRAVLETAERGKDAALPISYVVNQQGVPTDVYWHP